LSVAERTYEHSVSIVELGDAKLDVAQVPLTRHCPFLRVPSKGRVTSDEIEAALDALALSADLEPEERPFVQLCLQLDGPSPGLRARLDEICAKFPIRDVAPDIAGPEQRARNGKTEPLQRLSELSPEQLFVEAFEATHGEAPQPDHLACFRQLLDEAG
jgi:exonuclease SbcD